MSGTYQCIWNFSSLQRTKHTFQPELIKTDKTLGSKVFAITEKDKYFYKQFMGNYDIYDDLRINSIKKTMLELVIYKQYY